MTPIIHYLYHLQTSSDTIEYFHQVFQNGYITIKKIITCVISLLCIQLGAQCAISAMPLSRMVRALACIGALYALLWISKLVNEKVKESSKVKRLEWEVKYFCLVMLIHLSLIISLLLIIKFSLKNKIDSLTGIYSGLLITSSVFGLTAIYKSFNLTLAIHIFMYCGLIYISFLYKNLLQLFPVCLILSVFVLSAMNMVDDNSQQSFILSKKLSFENSMAFSFFESSNNPIMIISGKEKPIIEYQNKAWHCPPLNVKDTKHPIKELSTHMINGESINELIENSFYKTQSKDIKVQEMCISHNDHIYYYKVDISSAALMDTKFVFIHYIDNTRQIELTKSKMQDKMLCSITHELLTPLNSIMASSNSLLDLKDQIDAYTTLDINSSLLYLKIKDFICFSEHLSDKLFLINEPTSIRDTINRIVYLYSTETSSKNIKVNIYIDKFIPTLISCDKTKFMQIISNLLSNAIKFTTSLGIISISAIKTTNTVKISIQDNGSGFDQMEFEEGKLAGLGLTVIRCICQCMGTKLEVISAKNKGAQFWFSLKNDTQKAKKFSMSDRCVSQECNKICDESVVRLNKSVEYASCFIITDDIYFNRMTIKLMLNKLFKDAPQFEAVNGDECLNTVKKVYKNYSKVIVFMDVNMPVMDGIEATKQLVALRQSILKGTLLYIVGVTAFSMRTEMDNCLAAGMDEVITKPISIQQMQSIICAQME